MPFGKEMHDFAKILWPINRSLTGIGVRDTLDHIKEYLPQLQIKSVPSGTSAFDWVVPEEWEIKEGYIITPSSEKICDIRENNLHIVGYSESIDRKMSLSELSEHIFTLPNQPDAIPYLTSYYERIWGFCMSHNQFLALPDGEYHVVINSRHFQGNLTYGELKLPGETEKEILLSTYICHPSMANNELSGPVVTTFLSRLVEALPSRKLSYRILFLPETIGSITYLSQHLDELKSKVVAGFTVTCVGDDRSYSYLPSRNGNTLSDSVAKHVLRNIDANYVSYSWTDRGSDERQYCSPGIDLPIASIMRTKYGIYPEYHTSLDNLETVVTPEGLSGGLNSLLKAVEAIESLCYPVATCLGEPQLGKYNLYPSLSTKNQKSHVRDFIDVLTWADGKHTNLEIADIMSKPIEEINSTIEILKHANLIKIQDYF